MPTIQVQLAITFDDSTASALAQLFGPAFKQAMGLPSNGDDERREARNRSSRNAFFGGQELPEDETWLIDSRQLAKLLKLSERTLWNLHSNGKMPPPIRIGQAKRWSQNTIKTWVDAGCPVDPQWQAH